MLKKREYSVINYKNIIQYLNVLYAIAILIL